MRVKTIVDEDNLTVTKNYPAVAILAEDEEVNQLAIQVKKTAGAGATTVQLSLEHCVDEDDAAWEVHTADIGEIEAETSMVTMITAFANKIRVVATVTGTTTTPYEFKVKAALMKV